MTAIPIVDASCRLAGVAALSRLYFGDYKRCTQLPYIWEHTLPATHGIWIPHLSSSPTSTACGSKQNHKDLSHKLPKNIYLDGISLSTAPSNHNELALKGMWPVNYPSMSRCYTGCVRRGEAHVSTDENPDRNGALDPPTRSWSCHLAMQRRKGELLAWVRKGPT